MKTEIGTELIEHYLRTRGLRYFRGQHDREYFFILTVDRERLHVHLEMSRAHRELFTIRIAPGYFFPAADCARLSELAERWNRESPWAKAIVHESSDPKRIGVVAENSHPIADNALFDDLVSVVDHTIESAVKLFSAMAPDVEVTSGATPETLLRDAG